MGAWGWLAAGLLGVAAAGARGAPLADPTRPFGYRSAPAEPPAEAAAAGEEQQWSVAMIRYARGAPMALINGRAVAVGGRVGGARVVRIAPGSVELERNGERFEIALSIADVKRPAALAQGR